jgi:hypothetical protein
MNPCRAIWIDWRNFMVFPMVFFFVTKFIPKLITVRHIQGLRCTATLAECWWVTAMRNVLLRLLRSQPEYLKWLA